MAGVQNVEGTLELGGGAQFWVYISPKNDTAKYLKKWKVTFSQGKWSGTISSDNPQQQLKTPGLSGIFKVKVVAAIGPILQPHTLSPGAGCQADIGCNSNCASMVVIVAKPRGTDATYCTTWDAICSRGEE